MTNLETLPRLHGYHLGMANIPRSSREGLELRESIPRFLLIVESSRATGMAMICVKAVKKAANVEFLLQTACICMWDSFGSAQ